MFDAIIIKKKGGGGDREGWQNENKNAANL